MKKTAYIIFPALVIVGAELYFGSPADAQSETTVEQMFRDDIDVSVAQIESPAAAAVLSAPVFSVRHSLIASYEGALPDSRALSGDFHVWVKNDQLVPIFGLGYLSTDNSLDYLDGLIDPSFRLAEDSAGQFMAMLQELMGKNQFDPVPVDAIQNSGDTWYFLNGDFLSNYKGFVVTVDSEGAVTDLEFKLSMLPKDE